ncbi:pyroglutamyl-peptidase I [Lacicoccus alkaliphilus]|uniref:Pyrrolidone-carboxylate peptidase n=1 Tax=Lacicoccus alkaliphilus DSM 16010 TaxID=1123231 RepID=A0A1M7G9P0_9BACL|nr:pyroglutamyl-peptidase I [Salinicoccus alkaliphilus]SHM12569.1 pyroglutamyl-peptidase [Salinicoccus alkaliphilus DSM 16010]
MKVLMTGFDPFGGERINPALEAVKRLPDEIGGMAVVKAEIPTVFHQSAEVMQALLAGDEFDYVVAVGQAGGRSEMCVERIGINIDDARIPDNTGNRPIDAAIHAEGATAYFSNMPVKRMVKSMLEAGIPARLSNTAGTFVCNHILYQLGLMADTEFHGLKYGFIHVPYVPEQAAGKEGIPAMPLEDITAGLHAAVHALSEGEGDIASPMGEIH